MDQTPIIKFLRLRPELDADIPLPCYMTPRAAGMDVYAAIEKDLITRALQKTGGNRTQSARLLEISHPSLLSKMKLYEIDL